MILLYRVGIIVRTARRAFQAILALGLIIMLISQAIINMGVSAAIFPVTGQTLPLISMGGTSIIFTSVSLGIILNISNQIKQDNNESSIQNVDSNANKNETKKE